MSQDSMTKGSGGGGSRWVALGMLGSRVSGLVRAKVVAWLIAVNAHGDVVTLALRTPNLLQILLGEQTLSASFIPVYSRFLAEGRRDDARRFASAVLGLLMVAVAILVVAGIVFAPWIIAVLSPGYLQDAELVAAGTMQVDRYPLAIRAVRIIFPATGLLVLSAWALGILNSHRRFLLPYLAPAFWNASIVGVLVGAGWHSGYLGHPLSAPLPVVDSWVLAFALGVLVGGALQLGVQLPTARRLLGELRPRWAPNAEGVREAFALLGPTLLGRGVVQLNAWVDVFIASYLAAGAQSLLSYSVLLISLPLAVFGMSVAAAELPELAEMGEEQARREAPARIRRALLRSWFLVVPSAIGLLLLSRLVVTVLFSGGKFGADAAWLVAWMTGAYALGLIPSATSRLLQNSFYALRDTATPARIAAVRLACSGLLGGLLAWWLDRFSVVDVPGFALAGSHLYLGALGLALASAVAAWLELALLAHALRRRLVEFELPVGALLRRVALAGGFVLPALGAWWLIGGTGFVTAFLVLPVYPILYLGWARYRRSPELAEWLGGR